MKLQLHVDDVGLDIHKMPFRGNGISTNNEITSTRG